MVFLAIKPVRSTLCERFVRLKNGAECPSTTLLISIRSSPNTLVLDPSKHFEELDSHPFGLVVPEPVLGPGTEQALAVAGEDR